MTAANVRTWRTELAAIDRRLTAHPPLPPLLHRQLADRRVRIAAMLTTYDPTSQ